MKIRRKQFYIFALVYSAFCLLAYGYSYAIESPRKESIIKAEEAIADFQQNLKIELMAAMGRGGPEAAIHICNEKAPEIALTLSEQHQIELRRTSLSWRNPANEPSLEERTVLEDFERRKNRGAAISGLNAVLKTQDGLRYMKAIPMQGICAACHGLNIEPKLYQTIKNYYPDDKAIGFADGDIRGAFSVLLETRD